MSKEYPSIVNGLMGLNGEAGEAIDILKKHLFHEHELDKEHIAKELGDVAWYVAISADALGYDLETILQMNIDKLIKRYPDGFDAKRSLNRAEGDI
jgi:NTP pyrophosphatase (non-canonical NTP hydrolase)